MHVTTLRPHRNDHGKKGWKHSGTEYDHPDPTEDIKRGLVEPLAQAPEGKVEKTKPKKKSAATAPKKAAKGKGTKKPSPKSKPSE